MNIFNPNLDRHDALQAPIIVGTGIDGKTLQNIYIGVQVDASGVIDPNTATPIRGLHTCETVLYDLTTGVSGRLTLNGLKRKLSIFIENQIEEFIPTVKASGQAIFEAYDSTGGQVISNVISAIRFNNVRVNTDPSEYTRTQTSITVLNGGLFEVDARVTLNNPTATRTTSIMAIFRNGVEEPGSRAFGYHRNTANGEASLNTRIVLAAVQPGDTFDIRAVIMTGSNLTTVADASSVSVRKLF